MTSTTGEDLADLIPRSTYGGAWSAASDHFFYTVHDEAWRPFQVWRHELGTSYDAGRAGARGAGRAVRARACAAPAAADWSSCGPRAGTPARCGSSTPTSRRSAPRSVGGRRTGVEYHAEHAVLPDGTETLLVVTNDGAQEFRLARCPVPRDADQDHTAWEPVRPEDPAERLERVDAFATHVVLSFRSEVRHRLRVLPLDDLDGRRLRRRTPPSRAARSTRPTTRTSPRPRLTVVDESYVHPPVWSDVDLRHRRAHRAAPAGRPGTRPGPLRQRDDDVPRPRRHAGPRDRRTAPRHSARRHRPGPALRLRRLRGHRRPGVGPRAAEPARPPASSSCTPTSAAAARVAGAGGSRATSSTSSTPSPTTSRSPTASSRPGSSTGPGSPPGASARAASSRARCSASARTGGGPWSPRCRSSTWSPRCSTPRSRSPSTSGTSGATRGARRTSTGCSPTRRTTTCRRRARDPTSSSPERCTTPRVMVHEPAKWAAALRESDPEWSPRCLFRAETGRGSPRRPVRALRPPRLRGRGLRLAARLPGRPY